MRFFKLLNCIPKLLNFWLESWNDFGLQETCTFKCFALPLLYVILLVHSLHFVGLLCLDLDVFIIMFKISCGKFFELSSQRIYLTMLGCLVLRVKNDTPKAGVKPEPEPPTLANRRGERSESFAVEQRSGRDFERKDFRSDNEKLDTQRASWRNDNWKNNNREIEKPVERRLEPETWRKPAEQPKPEVPGTVSHHGKASSALELAQAFSRSVSDARADDSRFPGQRGLPGFPGQRGLPGRVQVPFSRLTDRRDFYPSSNSRQINGYWPLQKQRLSWRVLLLCPRNNLSRFHGLHFSGVIRQISIGRKRIRAPCILILEVLQWSFPSI